MTTRYWTTGVCGMALALLTGCRMGPDYRRPDLDPPAVFRDQPTVSEAASLADQPWWGVFGDDVLRQLVEQAIASNLDLRAAVWRIEQARAGVTIARSALFPQANYQGGGARAGTPAVGDPGAAVTLNSFNAALSAAWELDIWGRLRRGTEAAQAQCLAAEEVRRGVLLSLVGQVAQGYFTLRALDRELEVTRQTVDAYEKTLGMFNRRYEGGVDTLLSVERARANLAGAAAQAADIERSIAAQENSLCLLLALPPGPMPRGAALDARALPPAIPAGLPSQLLERRPDIRQAEANLRAANANVCAAKASFFPAIGLTALFGAQSPELNQLVKGRTMIWNTGGTLQGPVFQGGQLVGQFRAQKAIWEQAKLAYQSAALQAFGEVATLLNAHLKLEQSRVQQSRSVESLRKAVALSLRRYELGIANYTEVLDAQQLLFPAENQLVNIRLQQYTTLVQLYMALGGGWQLAP